MIDQISTHDTAEQFASEVQKFMINTGEKTVETAIDAVRQHRYPNADIDTLNDDLITNSCRKKAAQTKESITNQYVNTGTLDLFGYRGFDVPEEINKKPWEQATLMESKRVMEADMNTAELNAEEHRKLMEKHAKRAAYIADQIKQLDGLIETAMRAGYNPETLTYGQAKAHGLDTAA
jgi:hypothetical protein